MRLVIVSAFWNAEEYIERCIRSVMCQDFADFRMYLIDDLSSDGTLEVIRSAIGADGRFEVIANREKKFKLRSLDELIRDTSLIQDDDVIVELDGDDWLYDQTVLQRINNSYLNDKELWLTNGSFIYSTGKRGFSATANYKTVRLDHFQFSHLRTWKAFLWRAIKPESFRNSVGEYFRSAVDVAYGFPMVELAGRGHYRFLSDVLYVYNEESPFNVHKPGSADGGIHSQKANEAYIRRLPAYEPLRLGKPVKYQGQIARLVRWSSLRIRNAGAWILRGLNRLFA